MSATQRASGQPSIKASHVYYIKLGRGGEWEAESLRDGVLRFGYREVPHHLCGGDWNGVLQVMKSIRSTPGTAAADVSQIRAFYEADEGSIFTTFSGGLLYWCRPTGPVEALGDNSRRRATVDGWRSRSIGDTLLSADRLSGHLLRVQGFRGTICKVRAKDYLLRKLGDEVSPEVEAAQAAEEALQKALVGLMKLLTWQDFELLVDLVFSASGWRRISRVGGPQKTVDLELVLPSTGERAFVQVKSEAGVAALIDYAERLESAPAYDRMFFTWHTGSLSDRDGPPNVILLGPEKLSRMVVDAGLSSWLREKVA